MQSSIHRLKAAICALSLAIMSGCGGSTATKPVTPLAGKIYVTNGSASSLLRFQADMAGNVSPQSKIPTTVPGPVSLAIDTSHDRLAGASVQSLSFLVIDNASTTLGPVRMISGPDTTIQGAVAIAIDGATDLIYVVDSEASGPKILVFGPASTINGDVAPLRTITIPNASGGSNHGLMLDSMSNRLFLADTFASTISVFDNASTLNGTVVPNRVISGPATQLNFPQPMALDSGGNLIVVSNGSPATVLIFANAATANGNVAPANVAGIAVNGAIQIAVSPANELFVVDGGSALNVYSNITKASGNLTPSRVISGPNTGLDVAPQSGLISPFVWGLALDPTR
jgi:hypothetical protein